MAETETEMSLGTALRVLCEAHTRSDEEVGFTIQMGEAPRFHSKDHHSDYVRAWAVAREVAYPKRAEGER